MAVGHGSIVTGTGPAGTPSGTTTTMRVSDQLRTAAAWPATVTDRVPWTAPKREPSRVTHTPTGPSVGWIAASSGIGPG